jgi:CHAD domain-containing protein
MPAIDDLRALLERQLQALERHEPGVREGSDPEELHKFRVATRRSRALIRASRPMVRDQLATVDRELRWLGHLSGPVRDLDVLIDHLRELEQELEPDQAGVEAIVAGLERERLRLREELIKAIDSERYRELVARFAETLPGLRASNGEGSVTKLARTELDRLREAYDDLGEDPKDDDLHAVRIRAKHARYAAELAALSGGDAFVSLVDELKDVQDLIGAHQDAVVAEERVRALAGEESRLAVGRIVERERRRKQEARAELPEAMKNVERRAAKAF